MPAIPAICDQCGAVFASKWELGDSAQASFLRSSSGSCPQCGSMGTIPDGVYEAAGNTLRILATTPRSVTFLERLGAVVRLAREQGLNSEAAAIVIERETPQFAQLAVTIRHHKGLSAYQLLSIILAAIAVLAAVGGDISSHVTDEQLIHLFQEYVQSHPVIAPSANLVPPPARQPSPARRKEGRVARPDQVRPR
jgi:hypothetical protein